MTDEPSVAQAINQRILVVDDNTDAVESSVIARTRRP